ISLSSPSGRTVSGNASTVNGTALAGSDYTALVNAPWSIPAGATTTVVGTLVLGDTRDEPDETYLLNLGALINAATTGNDLQASATILDDDLPAPTPGTLRIVDASPLLVLEGQGTAAIRVGRSGGSDGVVGISFATVAGTASAGADYTTTSGTLQWPAGDTTERTVQVAIIDDALLEGRERFVLIIDAPTGGATLGSPSQIDVEIIDNESQLFANGFE
ncbi:MAG: Calx-beta domain-containing protein, partial [Lysobacterales bacterium]